MFVQVAFAVRVLIQRAQHKAGFELAADLLVERVRELHAAIRAEQHLACALVVQRIERQCIRQGRLVIVEDVVDAVVVAADERSAGFEHAVAFAEHGAHLLDVAVGYGVD